MSLKRLNSEDSERFPKFEEVAMGLQVVRTSEAYGWLAYVLGDLVLMTLDGNTEEQLANLLTQPWMQSAPRVDRKGQLKEGGFEQWLQSLPEAEPLPDPMPRSELAAFGLSVPPYLPPAPARPSGVYGHLPFGWHCGPNDVFYRYEPWPMSRRIDPFRQTIRQGKYASPASALSFNRTGFAAVARYALPGLLVLSMGTPTRRWHTAELRGFRAAVRPIRRRRGGLLPLHNAKSRPDRKSGAPASALALRC